MNTWRQSLFIKIIAYLTLCLMMINPALALQYQHFNQNADFLSKIPDYQAPAYHIHISQKDDVLALLKKQGYDVIPANKKDARHFLNNKPFSDNKPLQYAANFNLKRVYKDECSYTQIYCSSSECDKYPLERRKNCPEKAPPKHIIKTKTPTQPNAADSTKQNSNLGNILHNSGGSNNGGKDTAAIMLIVIGVVVVAALFIYAGKYIADVARGNDDYQYWWNIGIQYMFLDVSSDSKDPNKPDEHGDFSALKLSTGFMDDSRTQVGLVAELGYMDIDLIIEKEQRRSRLDLTGAYWLIGAIIKYNMQYVDNNKTSSSASEPDYFYLELMAGTSEHSETEIISVARLGFHFDIIKKAHWGFHLGALHMGLNEDQGFVDDG